VPACLRPGWDYQKIPRDSWLRRRRGWKYKTLRQQSVATEIYPATELAGANEFVHLKERGVLIAQKGYHWNGASGPTFDTPATMRASLFHDALYQLLREGKIDPRDRREADELLMSVMVEDGAWRWRARLWLLAVRLFAGRYARA
jgi:hypothetical protein